MGIVVSEFLPLDGVMEAPGGDLYRFELLGGGVNGDLAGLSASRLAVLPGTTHTGLPDRTVWFGSMILDFLD